MPLPSGTMLGRYEIVAPLGAGGMGEVYEARDPRLSRTVAIKVLRLERAGDEGMRQRFVREAEAIASLKHPNVCVLYDVGEHGDLDFLVMERLDGETLADRLRRGPLPLDATLLCGIEIAGALEAAHRRGFVHRDLKPGNVMLTTTGVKVLDFGLAKPLAPASTARADSAAATEAPPLTTEGALLGTLGYMSPEQLEGQPVDGRSDLFSLGAILFEMITGRRAFEAGSIARLTAAMGSGAPQLAPGDPPLPALFERIVAKCLASDPEKRWQSATDLADALRWVGEATQDQRLGGAKKSMSLLPWIAVGALALISTLLSLALLSRPDMPNPRVYTAAIALPGDLRLGLPNDVARSSSPSGRFALSPDGRRLALVAADATGRTQLWLRLLDSSAVQPLAGTEGAAFPFWSPDSSSIAFVTQGKLKAIRVDGGEPITVADAAIGATGTWNRDDVILFTPKGGAPIHRVSAAGGAAVALTTLDTEAGEVQHWYPFFLPDGRHFLYFAVGSKAGGATDPRAVLVGSLDSTEPPKLLVEGGSNAKFANGHLLFSRKGVLIAQPFDPARLVLDGEPVPLVEGVQIAGLGSTGTAGAFTVSETGLLAYQAGSVSRSQLAWFDRSGRRLASLGDEADYGDVMLSPDGSRVAVSLLDPAVGTRDLWIFDVTRAIRERLTFDAGDDFAPIWSRQDGQRIAFSSQRGGAIHLYQTTLEGDEVLLYEDPLGKFASDWSADGRSLAFVAGGGIISRSDLWVLQLDVDRSAHPLFETGFLETQGQFSPDGRWFSYTSSETGQLEVFVTPFPGPGSKRQLSTAGGSRARWRRDGREIFYLAPDDTLMAVAVDGEGARFEVNDARPLFAANPRPQVRLDAYPYDVSADGQRFIVNTLVDQPGAAPFTLVVNWPELLEK